MEEAEGLAYAFILGGAVVVEFFLLVVVVRVEKAVVELSAAIERLIVVDSMQKR